MVKLKQSNQALIISIIRKLIFLKPMLWVSFCNILSLNCAMCIIFIASFYFHLFLANYNVLNKQMKMSFSYINIYIFLQGVLYGKLTPYATTTTLLCLGMYVWITKSGQICKSISTFTQKEMLLFIYSWSPFLYLCRFVLSLENDLTVRSKTTEVAIKDFSSGSYACICHLL